MVRVHHRPPTAKRFGSAACIIVIVLGLFIFVLEQNDASSSNMMALTTSFMETAAAGSYGDGDCESLLDSMDQRFDIQREKSRQERSHYIETTMFNKTKIQFDGYEPESVCFTEERFGGGIRYGSLGDGPKFVCGIDFMKNAADDNCLVYNIGSNNEIAFEQAVKEHIGCEIHTFDPTLRNPYLGTKYSTFHPWGLGTQGQVAIFNGKQSEMRSLNGIITELGHEGRKINILKIDCETCEYMVMPKVFEAVAAGTLQIDQIQIEMHVYSDLVATAQQIDIFFAAMDKAGFRIFHKERNHIGCDGFRCVEYSLVHKSFLRKANAEVVCNRKYYKDASTN